MSKRGADRQITKDDPDSEQEEQTMSGTWKEAGADKLAQRKIVSVKRKTSAATESTAPAAAPVGMPSFNFGATPSTAAAASTTTTPTTTESTTETKTQPTTETPPAAPAKASINIFAAAQAGWECATCLLNNPDTADKCRSCETPNPNPKSTTTTNGDKKPEESKPTFTFGAPAASTTTSTDAASTTSTITPFSFGAGAGVTGFNFTTSVPAFTFGGASGSTLSFGSVATGSDSNGFKSEGGAGFESTDSLNVSNEMNEQFKNRTKEASGEENDTILFKLTTKAFQLKPVEKKTTDSDATATATAATPQLAYSEIGVGELHINTINGEKKRARMICRAEKTQRLILNCPIFDKMERHLQGDKFVRFLTVGTDGKPATYLLKFKTKSEAQDTLDWIEKAIEAIKA